MDRKYAFFTEFSGHRSSTDKRVQLRDCGLGVQGRTAQTRGTGNKRFPQVTSAASLGALISLIMSDKKDIPLLYSYRASITTDAFLFPITTEVEGELVSFLNQNPESVRGRLFLPALSLSLCNAGL